MPGPKGDLWGKIDTTGGPDECWPWTGCITHHGYGQVRVQGRGFLVHRHVYELLVGPIPTGLTIDHVCHSRDLSCPGGYTCPHRRCVNPSHLEPVTMAENRNRWLAKITQCANGHPFDEANTYTRAGSQRRVCRACNRERNNARYHRRKAGGL